MASYTLQGLQNLLEEVGVSGSIPEFASADVLSCPTDIYLSILADIIVQLTGCDRQVAYDSVAIGTDVWDLVTVIARLRLREDPEELAQHIADQVRLESIYLGKISVTSVIFLILLCGH